MRTLNDISDSLKPLDDVIMSEFVPALFGREISQNDREIFSLPIREGVLGIRIHHEIANSSYISSTTISAPLTKKIKDQCQDLPNPDHVIAAKNVALQTLQQQEKEKLENVLSKQTNEVQRNLQSGT